MNFPDQIHIDTIREALWKHPKSKRGTAAIMVGAGFSLNAIKISVSSRPMPRWADLAQSLHDALYLDNRCDGGETEGRFSGRPSATSEALRLAQEYEETHGRYALNKFILDSTPDNDYEPSPLHEKLLRLRWADIFTTNWDTLLERSCRGVIEQHYTIIRTTTDIPGSSAPRIVKLHGSFPSNLPLIFTEEDYRQYPINFAPFVNFVQQSMMENVFCLIGFSGDDPNFLHWSGWVRDNLGKTAPKIYLVGWHQISQVKRREMENRNIIPVDLANIPDSHSWPKEKRYQWAIEWFLENLERGEPWNKSDWPRDGRGEITFTSNHLKSVPTRLDSRPKKEDHVAASFQATKEELARAVQDVTMVWEYNRRLYPDWVVAPQGTRIQIWTHTNHQLWDILRSLTDFKPWERLFRLRELVWRLDVCLVPFDNDIADKVRMALDDMDPVNLQCRHNDALIEWQNPDWNEAMEAWTDLTVAMLRYYREEGMLVEFDNQAKVLEKLAEHNEAIRQVLWHQRSLLALEQLDYEALDKILAEWDPQHTDHIWALRKASLLAEADQSEEARKLATDTLQRIRQSMRRDIDDIAMMSREGWAMFFLRMPFEKRWPDRWNDLKVHKCDAIEIFDSLSNELKGDPPKHRSVTVERGFDLGTRTATQHSYEWSQMPAYQMMRLTEVAGIPSRIGATGFGYPGLAKGALERAALWVRATDPLRAIRLVMRLCTYDNDKTLNSIFRREAVAAIDQTKAIELAAILKEVVEHCSVRISGPTRRSGLWIDRLRVAMELLSRFVLRLQPEGAKEVLRVAIQLCGQERIRRHPWLLPPLTRLIARTVEAIPPFERKDSILSLIKLPTSEYAEIGERETWWLYDKPPESWSRIREASPEEWRHAVRDLIDSLSVKDRSRAVWRLGFLDRAMLLTSDERLRFGQELWREDLLDAFALPEGTGMYSIALLSLPEPEAGLAQKRIRKAYFSLEHAEQMRLHEYLHESGLLIRSIQEQPAQFDELSNEEKAVVARRVLEWANELEKEEPDVSIGSSDREKRKEALNAVGVILPILDLSGADLDKILEKIGMLENSGYACFKAYPALIAKRISLADDFIMKFRRAIASKEEYEGGMAVKGLWHWLWLTQKMEIKAPPDDLLSEIGIAIYVRRKSILWVALPFAAWLFDQDKPKAISLLKDRIIHGLMYLLEETRYELADSDPTFDLPLIRRECVKLILAMQRAGVQDTVIDQWIEAARNDPMPEIRYLIESSSYSD